MVGRPIAAAAGGVRLGARYEFSTVCRFGVATAAADAVRLGLSCFSRAACDFR